MSLRADGLDVARDRPEEPDEFPRDRDDRDLRPFAVRQVIEARVQPLLRLPRVGDHRRRLALLTTFESDADLCAMPIAPRGLHEHMPTEPIRELWRLTSLSRPDLRFILRWRSPAGPRAAGVEPTTTERREFRMPDHPGLA